MSSTRLLKPFSINKDYTSSVSKFLRFFCKSSTCYAKEIRGTVQSLGSK